MIVASTCSPDRPVFFTRTLSETLTGRVGLAELLPLSMGVRLGIHETFLDRLFGAMNRANAISVA